MHIPQPKTVKEAADILARVKARALREKKANEPTWYESAGKWLGDQAQNVNKAIVDSAPGQAFNNTFRDNAGNLSPMGHTLMGGLVGGGIGAAGGLVSGMTRQKKRPIGDMLTGGLIGGLGGAGIGAAMGHFGKAIEPGTGAIDAGAQAGADAIRVEQDHNNRGSFPNEEGVLANTTRTTSGLLSDPAGTGQRLMSAAGETSMWPAAAVGGAGATLYGGSKAYTALRNLYAQFHGPTSNRAWQALSKEIGSPDATINSKTLAPGGAAGQLVNLAADRSGMWGNNTVSQSEIANILRLNKPGAGGLSPAQVEALQHLADRHAYVDPNILRKMKGVDVGELNKWLGSIPSEHQNSIPISTLRSFRGLPPAAVNALAVEHGTHIPIRSIHNLLGKTGVGGVSSSNLHSALSDAVNKRLSSGYSPYAHAAYTAIPALLTHGALSYYNAGRLTDTLKEFVNAQPPEVRGNPEALAKAYEQMHHNAWTASSPSGKPVKVPAIDPQILARLRSMNSK